MKPFNGMRVVPVAERVFRAGYVVRTERVDDGMNPPTVMRNAYTPNGEYLGDPRMARMLIVQRGIRPQLRDQRHVTCSIGYNPWERKWYGWSHRAICGFRVGSVVKKGDVTAEQLRVGFRARTLDEAKMMAEAFAAGVS